MPASPAVPLLPPPPRPRKAHRPGCSCSTVTPWPTAPSSRCRWRTSRPRPGSTPTRSTASPRCSSTCCATSSRPTSRWPSTSPGQTFRAEQYAEYKANRAKSPDEFQGQVSLIKEVLNALRVPFIEKVGFEADDIIGTLATQAMADDFEVLICSRRPRLLPAGQRPHHRHLPDARRLGDEADDPGGGRGALRPAAGPLPRAGRPGGRDLGQPARRARESGRRPQRSGSPSTTASTTWSTTPRRSRARRARACASTSDDVIRNRRLNALVCDLDLPLAPRGPRDAAVGPPGGAHALRRPRVPGAPRAAVRDARVGGGDRRLRLRPGHDAARARPGRRTGSPPTPARASGSACTSTGPGARAPGTCSPSRSRPARAPPLRVSVEGITPEDDAALVSWIGDPHQPKVLHDAKGPMLALAARGWPLRGLERDTALSAYLARPDQRSYDLADLTVRYLKRELKQGTTDDGQLSLDGLSEDTTSDTAMLHASAVLDLATALDDELEGRGGTGLLADVELPLIDVLARMEQVGIAVDYDLLERARGGLRRPGARGRRRGVRRRRQGGQPRLAQAAAGGAVRRARHAEDQAHQDRLHHRRRRAAGPLREDRAPVPRAPARAPRRDPAAPDGRGPAQDRGGGRPDPHHVQPADRRHRPAVQHRPQPAEHPGPHRGRPPHPRGRSWSGRGSPS